MVFDLLLSLEDKIAIGLNNKVRLALAGALEIEQFGALHMRHVEFYNNTAALESKFQHLSKTYCPSVIDKENKNKSGPEK